MIPRSNAGLDVGDTCFIRRDDGRHVPFVYVGKRDSERLYFFGAFGALTVATPQLSELPPNVTLGDPALVHVKCYSENDTPIVGNILDRLDPAHLERMAAGIQNSGVGHVTRVWGWRTLRKKANDIAA